MPQERRRASATARHACPCAPRRSAGPGSSRPDQQLALSTGPGRAAGPPRSSRASPAPECQPTRLFGAQMWHSPWGAQRARRCSLATSAARQSWPSSPLSGLIMRTGMSGAGSGKGRLQLLRAHTCNKIVVFGVGAMDQLIGHIRQRFGYDLGACSLSLRRIAESQRLIRAHRAHSLRQSPQEQSVRRSGLSEQPGIRGTRRGWVSSRWTRGSSS